MRLLVIIGLLGGIVFSTKTRASQDSVKPLKIAVFAPVYLDSAFTDDVYKLGRNNLPKYILPGLDFYNGMMMAVDSLNAEKAGVEVLFYDSKNTASTVRSLETDPNFDGLSLIIASFNNRSEVKPLAELAMQRQVPLISATYPNDGGVGANPYFVMLNSNLTTHIEAIFRYMQKNYPLENILVFRRKTNTADFIQYTLAELNRKTAGTPLKLKTVELSDSFTVNQVTGYLDSTKPNIVFCGSLDERFGLNLSKALASSKSYPVAVIGMPTWDGIKDIGKGIDITYSTPYNLTRTDKISQRLTAKYRELYAGRPSDMFFKGFESMYHFSKLLVKHRDALLQNLSDKDHKIFAEFDLQPVRINKENTAPDYLENKKIYFIRRVDGKLKSVN